MISSSVRLMIRGVIMRRKSLKISVNMVGGFSGKNTIAIDEKDYSREENCRDGHGEVRCGELVPRVSTYIDSDLLQFGKQCCSLTFKNVWSSNKTLTVVQNYILSFMNTDKIN